MKSLWPYVFAAVSLVAAPVTAAPPDALAQHLLVAVSPDLPPEKGGGTDIHRNITAEEIAFVQKCKDRFLKGEHFERPSDEDEDPNMSPINPADPIVQLAAAQINYCLDRSGHSDLIVIGTPLTIRPYLH